MPEDTWRPDYWAIIRYSATYFLTDHAESGAQLYQDRLRPTVAEDLWHLLRSVGGGVARLTQGLCASCVARRPRKSGSGEAYLLLVAPGSDKYAREEREVVQACAARSLGVLTVHSNERSVCPPDGRALSAGALLTPGDHCRVLAAWLLRSARGARWLFSRDRKARSLYVASIPGIRQYYLDAALVRRIVAIYGRPRTAFSLSPWTDVSVAVVDHLKENGVVTAGIRTQTTVDLEEHAAINTDILFCKGLWERTLYGRLFQGHGPRLEDGCLLSLPEEYALEPLALPERYVLVLGTARRYNQDDDDYREVCETLDRVAAGADLPVVYKGHPAHTAEGARFRDQHGDGGDLLVFTDLRRNRELVDRASLVVSAHSTLLYEAILSGVPVVIVDADPPGSPDDEFHGAPIERLTYEDRARTVPLDRESLRDSAERARDWFRRNYFLDRDAVFLVDYLLSLGDERGPGTQTPRPGL